MLKFICYFILLLCATSSESARREPLPSDAFEQRVREGEPFVGKNMKRAPSESKSMLGKQVALNERQWSFSSLQNTFLEKGRRLVERTLHREAAPNFFDNQLDADSTKSLAKKEKKAEKGSLRSQKHGVIHNYGSNA